MPSPFGFYFGAKFSLNKVDEEERVQPFEASAMLGFEYEWRAKKHFSLEPSIDATFLHYMLYSSIATHSENENRTAFTVALSCELPFMAVFEVERVSLSFGAGIAAIIRGSALDLGIKGDDVGASGLTASDEVKKINLYHWQSGRWFYPTLRFKTGYTFESGWKASLLFGAYIPIFNAWNKNHLDTKNGKVPFLHDAIFNIGFSIHPAKKK